LGSPAAAALGVVLLAGVDDLAGDWAATR